jgi:Flp pilus assembly protein TadG
MKQNSKSLLHRTLMDQRGQVLPMFAVILVALIGITGFVVDAGRVYVSYRQLQASTDAAALAGAQGLPFNTTTTNQAVNNATAYSSQAGDKNVFPGLSITSASFTLGCVTAGAGAAIPCTPTGVGVNTANAIQVKQTAKVPLYFIALLGTSSTTLTATSTALMRGGTAAPYNVAIIVDTTNSMTTNIDANCNNVTRLQCALNGVQVLLKGLSPCAASGCGGSVSNQNYPNSLDRVSLFSFPNVTTTTAPQDYDCGSSSPTPEVYTFPPVGASSLSTMPYTTTTGSGRNQKTTTVQMTYQVTYGLGGTDGNGFVSDFRTSDTSGLNAGSDIVLAAGGKSGCTGLNGPGGEGTFYAGVIYAAQAALTAEQTTYPNAQNVLILVSDGAATAGQSNMATGTQSTTVAVSNGKSAQYPTYLYPSWNNECQQAALAAQYATSQGTTVYSVAYGSPSSGCTTDSGAYASPCYTMSQIASSSATFYSDDLQSGTTSNCPAGKSVVGLDGIFTQILGGLTHGRLIPNSAFPSS